MKNNHLDKLIISLFVLICAIFLLPSKIQAVYYSNIEYKSCKEGNGNILNNCICPQGKVIYNVGNDGANPSGINSFYCANINTNSGQAYWGTSMYTRSYSAGGVGSCGQGMFAAGINFPSYYPQGVLCVELYVNGSKLGSDTSTHEVITYRGGSAVQCTSPRVVYALGDLTGDLAADTVYCMAPLESGQAPTVTAYANPNPTTQTQGTTVTYGTTNNPTDVDYYDSYTNQSYHTNNAASGNIGISAHNSSYYVNVCASNNWGSNCARVDVTVQQSQSQPTGYLTVDYNPLYLGDRDTLRWGFSNAQHAQLCGVGITWGSNYYSGYTCFDVISYPSGYIYPLPPSLGTTTYRLNLWNDGGSVVTIERPLLVVQRPTTTRSVDLKVNGSDGPVTVSAGSTVNLSWTSYGTAICDAAWSGMPQILATSGSQSYGPVNAQKTFSIACYRTTSGQDPVYDNVTVNVTAAPSGFTFRYNGASCSGSNLVYNFSWGTLSSATAYMFISRDQGLSDFVYPPTLSYGYPGSRFPNIFSTKSSADFEAVGVNGNNYSWATPVAGNGATVVTTSFNKPGLRVPKSSLNCAQPPTVTLWADNTTINPGQSTTVHWTTTDATSATLNGVSVAVNGSQSTGALNSTTTYTLVATGPGGTAQKSITINVQSISSFNAIFIAKSINISRSSTLNISQDSNAISNPPPGFADLSAPIFKEVAP
jgi:hypothetical protein